MARTRVVYDAATCPICKDIYHGRGRYCSHRCCKRAVNVRKAYGLQIEEYVALMERADGRCEMCGDSFGTGGRLINNGQGGWGGNFVIDHCHDSGRVRGVLCGKCNVSLGHYEKIKALAEPYLESR